MKLDFNQHKSDNDLIRLQIDNKDNALSDELIESIIDNLSKYTGRLSKKYKISNERFKLIMGRSMIEKILRLE